MSMAQFDIRQPASQAATPRQASLNNQAREIAERFSASSISQVLLVGAIRLLDAVIVISAGLAAHEFAFPGSVAIAWPYLAAMAVGVVLTPIFAQAADAYHVVAFRSLGGQVGRLLGAWTLVFAGFAVIGAFFDFGGMVQRSWMGF